jgi:hypothetical protein
MTSVPDTCGGISDMGCEDARPDSATNNDEDGLHGNGDVTPESLGCDIDDDDDVVVRDSHHSTNSNKNSTDAYGYEDATPDRGYSSSSSQPIPNLDNKDATPDLANGDSSPHIRAKLGYEDASPELGYGDAPPDSATRSSKNDPYGYGRGSTIEDLGYEDAAPDLGYGDAPLDSATRISKNDPYGYGRGSTVEDLGYEDAAPDLGYGDAPPDSATRGSDDPCGYGRGSTIEDLGYEDASPDLGYGDTPPDSATRGRDDPYGYGRGSTIEDLGYGEATPDHRDALGYEDASPDSAGASPTKHDGYDGGPIQMGYNDEVVGGTTATTGRQLNHRAGPPRSKSDESLLSEYSARTIATSESYGEYSQGEGSGGTRKNRYRRRGSVTKYSIGAQDTVKQEYDDHANLIDQFRSTMLQNQQDFSSKTDYPIYHEHQPTHNDQQPTGDNEQWQHQAYQPRSPDHNIGETAPTTTNAGATNLQVVHHKELTVTTEDSFDEPTGLPIRSTHSHDDIEQQQQEKQGSPRRFAAVRKTGKEGKKLITRIRRRFSMSS